MNQHTVRSDSGKVWNAGFPGKAALAFVFGMVFIMSLVKIYSPDLGFHLKSAKWILENKQFIYTDSFSYASEGNKYFDFQWLYQLFIYGVHALGSDRLLVIVNALLIVSSLVFVWQRFKQFRATENAGKNIVVFSLFALVFVQPLTAEIRPHVLSWIFLNLTLLILESFKKGNKKIIYYLPFVMLVWANVHSLAILGLVTTGIYNLGNYLENGNLDKRLLLFSFLGALAFLLTPYFIDGLAYPLTQFGIISGNSLSKSYIGELQSPFSSREIAMLGKKYFTSPVMILHLAAGCSFIAILRSLFQRQYTDMLLLSAYLVLLYMANKNYGYFLVASLPVMVQQFLKWKDRKKFKKAAVNISSNGTANKNQVHNDLLPDQQAYNLRPYHRLAFAVVVLAVFISVTSITDAYPIFRHSPYRFGFITDKDQLPVEATSFLNEHNIKGKLLNHLDFGGYLMAYTDEKVFIDGRLEPIEDTIFEKYDESLRVRFGIKKLLDKYNPDIVIFPYVKAAYWWDYFISKRNQSGYKAVYFDGLSVIYLKSVAFPGIPELNKDDVLKAAGPVNLEELNNCIENSKPDGVSLLINGLVRKQLFSISDQNKAVYCFGNGYDTAGIKYSIRGIQHSTVNMPNIYKNLSVYFNEKKMYQLAELCENRSE